MLAISPTLTERIDRYAENALGIPTVTLMARAGKAVADAVAGCTEKGGRVLILSGAGNNGGDGYAAALLLMQYGYRVAVSDVLGAGQRSEAGRHFLQEYERALGTPLSPDAAAVWEHDCLVDAVLGTGARLPLSEAFYPIAEIIRKSTAKKIAVDLPLGVEAEGGRVDACAVRVDETVMLGFPKYGLYSYPARGFTGRLTTAPIGLDTDAVRALVGQSDHLLGHEDIKGLLPVREKNSHKGSFGHLLLLTGSRRYRGAALLSGLAALRMGAGLVTLASEEEVLAAAAPCLPELILAPLAEGENITALTEKKTAILIGPGSGHSDALFRRLCTLLSTEGAPLVLDADAINALASPAGRDLLRQARRPLVLTPHPAELARLLATDTATVQADRLSLARRFAAEYPATLVLKGAATVIAEGDSFTVNTTGGPALAKGGSGDVLAGAIASLVASGLAPYNAARIAVLLHGAAGDRLEGRFSPLGVRPSDLPDMMAELLAGYYR